MAPRIKAAGIFSVLPNVVKFAPEIGQVLAVGRSLAFFPAHLAQTFGKVKCNFSLRGVQREGAIPRTAIPAIEPAAFGAAVSERGIYDVRVGNAEYQFVDS